MLSSGDGTSPVLRLCTVARRCDLSLRRHDHLDVGRAVGFPLFGSSTEPPAWRKAYGGALLDRQAWTGGGACDDPGGVCRPAGPQGGGAALGPQASGRRLCAAESHRRWRRHPRAAANGCPACRHGRAHEGGGESHLRSPAPAGGSRAYRGIAARATERTEGRAENRGAQGEASRSGHQRRGKAPHVGIGEGSRSEQQGQAHVRRAEGEVERRQKGAKAFAGASSKTVGGGPWPS